MTSKQRRISVDATSIRRIDVDTTLGCVPDGVALDLESVVGLLYVIMAFPGHT